MASITPEKLKEISNLAENVPEAFRLKCFELLLAHSLAGDQPPKEKKEPHKDTEQKKGASDFVLPIDVKAFLNQYSLEESIIQKLFFIEGSEIRPLYKLNIHKKAKAQMSHALLMALENALSSGEFKFTVDGLRQRCIDQKCYDKPNFMAVLERNKNLYKSYDPKKDIHLSTDGKTELADVIEKIK
ncbi:MAG: hypothetical protein AB1728_06515 [Bacteroidota bacterium]